MIVYLIKMMVCSGILLLGYALLLSKETTHHYNRFYLLASCFLSFLIPLIEIEWTKQDVILTEPVNAVNEVWIFAQNTLPPTGTISPVHDTSLHSALIVYFIITGLLLFRFCRNLYFLLQLLKSGRIEVYQNSKLVLLESVQLPFSFLNFVFLGKKEAVPEIVHHELAHVRQKHSLDILLIELLLVVTWFNPFWYGYKKAIRLNHEYLADDAVIQKFSDIKSYQHLLLYTATTTTSTSLTSSFNFITTKNRIVMMLRKTSPEKAFLMKAATIILITATLFLVSSKLTAQEKSDRKVEVKVSQQKKDTAQPLAWVGESIGFTKEGVSEELLQEYNSIVKKYFNDERPFNKTLDKITKDDRERLEEIFKQMNPEQQSKQKIAFLKPLKPFSKEVPTKKQFEAFKNPRLYGVWIDDKKVSNDVLSNYNNTDFSHVFISKLYGAAKKGRSYTHQVDLMTNEFYKNYYEEALKNKKSMMVYRSFTKRRTSSPDKN